MKTCDVCGARLVSRRSTAKEPYHYVLSGLPNVYLVGVEVRRCPKGDGEAPVLVRMDALHAAIARLLIEKPAPLSGDEIRYLRKFAGMQAQDFAARLGMVKATFSRVENGAQRLGPGADKLVRAIAAAARGMTDEAQAALLALEGDGKAAKRVTLKSTSKGWSEAA